ncbi:MULTISPECIES: hypothetical protein [Halorussus]|uniref:hypothetical protein n=1 Tax=Halorussus TaxID=1070314 RepID=UPI000E2163F1|nr:MULTISPECIES: hypothetical protein [Halorussus]NHN59873.1 hypothetical protein [Halorussus sp. JP-T4]
MSPTTNRTRRAVLRGLAALTGVAGASGAVAGDRTTTRTADDRRTPTRGAVAERAAIGSADDARGRSARQQVDTDLPPGVTLFDLNDDGAYTARVEAAPEAMRDDAHPRPIHVTSGGNSTVDYAASIAEPSAGTTLGGLDRLAYDYYEGPNNVNRDGSGALAPDQTFLVVENDDGRHGMYLTYGGGGEAPTEEWRTFDVLARMRGQTGGTSGWFEYTETEDGYEDRSFDDVVARFGADARLVRVGVGHGDAVNPTTLDVYYDNLAVGGTTTRFPVDVAKRVDRAPPVGGGSN